MLSPEPEQNESGRNHQSGRLDSWKEIAAYLNRGARTVQRWEKTEDLPVHRHMHDKLGSVYAYKPEIDAWWASRRARLEGETTAAPVAAQPSALAPSPARTWRRLAIIACAAAAVIAIAGTWRFSATARVPGAPRIVPLTTFPGFEHAPIFSPDGRKVAFVWKSSSTNELDIYYKVIGGGEPVRVTDDPGFDFSPSWSPNGESMAFGRVKENGTPEIIIRSLADGSERKVADFNFGAFPAPNLRWSGDARWLIVADKPDRTQPAALFRVAVDSGEKRRITNPPPGIAGDGGFAFSSDGKRLAFVRSVQPTARDIYTIDLTPDMLAASEPRRVTHSGSLIGDLNWLPGSDQILYAVFLDFYSSWWQVASSGSQPRRRDDLASLRPGIAISPDSRRAVFTESTGDQNIWRLDLRTGEHHSLVMSTRIDVNPQISPDGNQIVFASDRAGNVDIWKCNSDGRNAVPLASFPGKSAGTPRWSPDGGEIVFDVTDGANADIWVMAADGGRKRRLTADPARDFVPSWSRDGKRIYFGSLRSGRPEVWSVPASGGEAVQITRSGAYGGWESEDGKSLYYTKEVFKDSGGKGIFRQDLDTGVEEIVTDAPVNWSRFALAGGNLYYLIRSSDDAYAVHSVDPTTKATRVAATVRTPATMGFSVARDAKWLVYTAVERESQDLMLVENFR
jgi:eukaryotic-like serine/threonine-protein kinase